MNRKLYVGNLPYSVTEITLREMFSKAGEVSTVSIITDRDTGRPRGFAFVEMASDDGVRQAISQINGESIDNRMIMVAEARPQQSGFSGGNRGSFRGNRRF